MERPGHGLAAGASPTYSGGEAPAARSLAWPAVVVGGRRMAGIQVCGAIRLGRGDHRHVARAWGVPLALGLMEGWPAWPWDAAPGCPPTSRRTPVSRLFKAAVAEIAPAIEDRGIDEIFIDLTDVPGETVDLGAAHQGGGAGTPLGCHWGVTPNKLLSKIASELQKPDGSRGHPHLATFGYLNGSAPRPAPGSRPWTTIRWRRRIPRRWWPPSGHRAWLFEPGPRADALATCGTQVPERGDHLPPGSPRRDRDALSHGSSWTCRSRDPRKGRLARTIGIKLAMPTSRPSPGT